MFQELFARVDRFLDILQQFADTYDYSFAEDECDEGEEEPEEGTAQ